MAQMILETDEPRKQKAFGRKVQNFEKDIWNEKCRDIVKKGNREKVNILSMLDTHCNPKLRVPGYSNYSYKRKQLKCELSELE